ncbi:MAG: DNA-directed RNA polymerase subunit alpha [Nitrospiraceae bacterium]|nr:MAG: DNA-directed RNA polymerase subunit alpha [Nitrospiraceae bacterium]
MDLKEKGFQLPENIYFDSESLTTTYGKLYAEAFERGFGTTVGNALRRVLLSSIEGAAVTSMRVSGVLHEFSNLNGVKEDFVDVVLNVKQLRFKLNSDTPQVATIDVKGPSDVTGKDIVGNHVEVLTPDQHILTLGNKAKFSMELTIEKGKGYVTADENKDEDQPVDTIAIDSIFTPIKKVNYWVEGARVGRSTDYDKLVMEIWTDGSISPQTAVSQAAGILNEHLSLFSFNGAQGVEEESAVVEEVEEEMPTRESFMSDDFYEEEPMEINDALLKNVEELELSVRSYNCLKNANIRTLADLVQKTEQEMLRTKNFGRKSLNEIKEIIQSMGLNFNMRVDDEELQKLASSKRTDNAS